MGHRRVNRRHLVALASSKHWLRERGSEEIGDALYIFDPHIQIEFDPNYPLLYVFSSTLTPEKTFAILRREALAYIERIIPATLIVKDPEPKILAANITNLLKRKGINEINVEVRGRRYFIREREGISKAITRFIEEAGLRVRRKASNAVRIEDTMYGIVVGVIVGGSDRVQYWRARMLARIGLDK